MILVRMLAFQGCFSRSLEKACLGELICSGGGLFLLKGAFLGAFLKFLCFLFSFEFERERAGRRGRQQSSREPGLSRSRKGFEKTTKKDAFIAPFGNQNPFQITRS